MRNKSINNWLSKHMSRAQRFSTEYIDYEDRVRLTYLIEDESTHIAWLTHRFLDKLVTHTVAWLEKIGQPMPRGDAWQSFSQDVAISKLPEQPPVKALATTPSWIVYSVDFKFNETAANLILKNRDDTARAELQMNIVQLRQWLNIIHHQYVKGGWNLKCWPDWLIERGQSTCNSPNLLH